MSWFDLLGLKDGGPQKRSIFAWFMTMRGRQISARAIEIQKEYWGVTMHFLRDNQATIILKNSEIQSNVRRFFFQIEVL